MALHFPNRTRFYDAARRAVQFWGYDSTREAVFFVAEDALKRVHPGMQFDEPGLLGAFDGRRSQSLRTRTQRLVSSGQRRLLNGRPLGVARSRLRD